MKKLVSVILIITVLILSMPAAFASAAVSLNVYMDGKYILDFPANAQPYIDSNNRTMVPIRFISQDMGGTVTWEGTQKLVTITKDDKRVAFKIGDTEAITNSGSIAEKKSFDAPAVLKNNRTFVPLRFISEALGANVAWDSKAHTVLINTNGSAPVVGTEPKSMYDDFDLAWTVGTKPADYIVPHFRVVYTPDSQSSWYNIEFVNVNDYAIDPSSYTIKTEYLNAPKLNKWQGLCPNGTPGEIVDITTTDTLKTFFIMPSNPEAPSYIVSLGRMWYTTIAWEKDYKLYKEMQLKFQITFTKGHYKEIYQKLITLK